MTCNVKQLKRTLILQSNEWSMGKKKYVSSGDPAPTVPSTCEDIPKSDIGELIDDDLANAAARLMTSKSNQQSQQLPNVTYSVLAPTRTELQCVLKVHVTFIMKGTFL